MKKSTSNKISTSEIIKSAAYIKSVSKEILPIITGTEKKIQKIHGIKAVIFDIYGTLFISASGDISLANNQKNDQLISNAFSAADIPLPQDDDLIIIRDILKEEILKEHKRYKENGNKYPEVDIISMWKNVFSRIKINTESYSETSLFHFAAAFELAVNPVWPMPESSSILSYLHDKKYTMGIVSNAQCYTPLLFPAFSDKNHTELGFQSDLCIWSYLEHRAKPDIKLFLNLLTTLNECYNIKPFEGVYVGNDMLNDVWTASECGMKTILFAGDKRSLRLREDKQQVKNCKPDCIITNLNQIREII